MYIINIELYYILSNSDKLCNILKSKKKISFQYKEKLANAIVPLPI